MPIDLVATIHDDGTGVVTIGPTQFDVVKWKAVGTGYRAVLIPQRGNVWREVARRWLEGPDHADQG